MDTSCLPYKPLHFALLPYNMFNNKVYTLRTTYSSERALRVSAFAVVVMDGGNNFIGQLDVDQLGAGVRRDLQAAVSGDLIQAQQVSDGKKETVLTPGGATAVGIGESSTRYSATMRRSALGEGVIDDLTLVNPGTGNYTVTISSPGLVSYSFEISISPGYPSSLDVCGCPTCSRRVSDGVCVDTRPYLADVRVPLRDALVVMRDAGGALAGTNWDSGQIRNITGELIYGKNQATGMEVTYTLNMTALSNFSKTYLVAQEGMVAWCANGTEASPIPRFCRPADLSSEQSLTRTIEEYLRRRTGGTEPLPVTGTVGKGLVYYGVQSTPRWVGNSHGLNLDFPYTGVYRFQFASFCPPYGCSYALYRELQFDQLEITVLPGTPHQLKFSSAPPAKFENDFVIHPAIQFLALDVAGNLCTNLDTFAVASVSPEVRKIQGQVAPVIGGVATFPALRVQGHRGTVYTLSFEIVTMGLTIKHSPFLVIPCEDVKPNSQNDGRGQCECMPGYTEDTRSPAVFGTGFTDDMSSVSSYPSLYKQVVYRQEGYLKALKPYGVCVPCANGYYKPLPGAQNCTKCPLQMDTMWEAGQPKGNWTTLSGEFRPGHLGNHRQDACHCIVRRSATNRNPPLETYRLLPKEIYRCEKCPHGGVCNGLSKQNIVIDQGKWRVSTNMTTIYDCVNAGACLGGENSECSKGYTGNLCAVCARGYAHPTLGGRHPPKCSKCPPSIVGGVVLIAQFIVQGIVVMTIFRVASRERNGSVGLFKTLLSHFQMMVCFMNKFSQSFLSPSLYLNMFLGLC